MAAKEDVSPRPFLTLEGGGLEGVYLVSRNGKSYAAFLGIPYADPPERFELAKPATPWTGIRDASRFGPACLQWDRILRTTVGSEEHCLTINVFIPAEHFSSVLPTGYESISRRLGKKMLSYVWSKPTEVKVGLPVLVYIHGERFQFGSSDQYGADYLMDEDVILVTFNYRLGALGFLSTGDEVLPGNLGLKDQNLALQWVQKHILVFGGNAKNVTLYGEGAGGVAVSLHLVSPLSRGLFQKAICSSGTCFDEWVFQEDPKRNAADLAKLLNGITLSSEEIKNFMKTRNVLDICRATQADKNPLHNPWLVPVIEAKGTPNAFLTESPRVLYSAGNFAKIPLLVTANAEEGLAFKSAEIMKNPQYIAEINNHWYDAAPHMYNYDHLPETSRKRISEDFLMFYFSNKHPILTKDSFHNFTNSFSDTVFIFGTRELAIMHAVHATTYAAILDIRGTWSSINALGYPTLGMAHRDDLQYVFNSPTYPTISNGSDTLIASQRLIRMYTNFAKFGDPNHEPGRKYWLPVDQGQIVSRDLNWMYIKNNDYEHNKVLLFKRMKFCDQFYQAVGMV